MSSRSHMRSLGPMGRHRLPAARSPNPIQRAESETEVATTNVAAELLDTGVSHVRTTLRGDTHDTSISDPALDISDARNHPSSSGLVEVANTNVTAELSDTGVSHVGTTLRGNTHDTSISDPASDISGARNHSSHPKILGKRKRQPWKAKPCFTDLARLCFDIDNWPTTAKEARLLVCSTTCCLILSHTRLACFPNQTL